jgi:D-beta-D-heptose 7-phosphate kinase/D-beta-D-heptose 1-phosphate adenosyltransferase
MLDRFIRGSVSRISPEAPVPVVQISDQFQTPGGAGNVVENIVALGGHPSLISVRGNDLHGDQVALELKTKGTDLSGLIIARDRPTITKTRIIAGQQQVVRLDVEKPETLPASLVRQISNLVSSLSRRHKSIILSDYGKGVISKPVIASAVEHARTRRIPLVVDPKIEHFYDYKEVDCITPNTKESIEGMRVLPPKTEDDVIALGWDIVKKLKTRCLIMTRGEKGMMVFQKGEKVKTIESEAREVFDVTGAGDTVVSTLGLARAVGVPYYEAALIANAAAGLVVRKLGTAVVTQSELIDLLKQI